MIMTKKSSVLGAWAKKEAYEYEGHQYDADLQHGDVVTILDDGTVTQGEYGEQNVFSIKTRNGEKNVALNQASINVLIDTYGLDSIGWINKPAHVLLKKDVVAGKRVIIAYLVTEGWYLDDFGDLTNAPQVTGRPAPMPTYPVEQGAAMPQSVVDAQNLQPGDVPF